MKIVSVTVNYKTAELACRAIDAALPDLRALGGRAMIVDNHSGDGSIAILRAAAHERWGDDVVILESDRNAGFGAGNNLAFREAMAWPDPPEYFYLLNPDAKPDPGAISTLVDFMDAHPRVGMAGSKVRHEDGSFRLSSFRFPSILSEVEAGLRLGLASRLLERWRVWGPPPERTGPVDWVSGASVILRRRMLEEVGLFDETFFLYFEETDLARRALRAGWPTYWVLEAEAEHIGQVSTNLKDGARPRPGYWFDSRSHYFRKNHGALDLWAANAAFVGASALYQLRRRAQRKPDEDPPHLLRDFVRHALRARK
jgi:N-acetylglucosaminyl-diphospho-decaprenol L-rhamnosyltransferase